MGTSQAKNRKKAIERSNVLTFDAKKEEKELRSMLEKLTALECEVPGVYAEDLRNIKQKLELFEEQSYRGALVIARAKTMMLDENPTKRALEQEKSYARRNHIENISTNGAEAADRETIGRAFSSYYEALLPARPVDTETFKRVFLSKMPRASDENKAAL